WRAFRRPCDACFSRRFLPPISSALAVRRECSSMYFSKGIGRLSTIVQGDVKLFGHELEDCMSWNPEVDEIERRKQFAYRLGGEEAVRRQHEAGRLTARERIDKLVDPGRWFEIGGLAGKGEYDKEGKLLNVRPSNAIIGTARLNGRKVSLDVDDWTIRGGS